jgi:predicted flap endonuclease-1-like 5' DNA nuclease
MAERFTADLLFIVIVLLIAALLGYLIGYYLAKGKYRKQIADLEEEKARLEAKIRKLEEEKLSLQADVRRMDEEKLSLQADIRRMDEEKLSLKADIRRMDDEIASLKLTIDRLEKEAKLPGERPAEIMPKAPEARTIVPDDLKAVQGIGSKISRLLMNRGITTWKALSEATPDYLREILINDGGERFKINNPDTWPHQALLLHEGRFDELKELQFRLQE